MTSDYEHHWLQLSDKMQNDFLRSLEQIQDNLERGALCDSLSTCPRTYLNDDIVQATYNLVDYDGMDQCRLCSMFFELRPDIEQENRIAPRQNYCPCMIFGREEAMLRLASVNERLKTELTEE